MVISAALVIASGLLVPNNQSLTATAEWASYKAALSELGTYKVGVRSTLMWPVDAGDCSVIRVRKAAIAVQGDGSFVLDTDARRYYRDGNSFTAIDRRPNLVERGVPTPDLTGLVFLDLPVGSMRLRPGLSSRPPVRLTREPGGSGLWLKGPQEKAMTGWELSGLTQEHTFAVEYWFDPDTHLVALVVESAVGPTLNYRCEHRFTWDTHPNLPAGYFKPRLLIATELDRPYSKVGQVTYSPGTSPETVKGRLAFDLPPGVTSDITVIGEPPGTELNSVGGRIRLALNPGTYWVHVGPSSIEVVVQPGWDAKIAVGGIESKRETPVKLLDPHGKPSRDIRARTKAFAILAGTYYVLIGDTMKKIVVVEGKVTQI